MLKIILSLLLMPCAALAQHGYPIVRAEQRGEWGISQATITAVSATANNDLSPLTVKLFESNYGAFGDILVAEQTPVIQMDFVYGIHPQISTYSVTATGTADVNLSRLRLQTGTDSSGAVIFRSNNPARYRAGEGMTARFTVAFTTGVANSTQTVGMSDNGDGYFFGFNGATFGILHKNRGAETWYAQSAWNGDKANGTGESGFNLDHTKGNVYQISYPYLGFGNIRFFIQDNTTSRFVLVHTIRYNNTYATTQLSNPSLKFYAKAANSGSTTNVVTYLGSVGVFLNGQRRFLGPQFGVSNIKTAVSTEQNIFAIRNATTYNGIVNTGVLRLRSLSFANDNGTAIGQMRIIKGATMGGVPSFTPVRGSTADNGVTITSGESVASFDVAGSTGTGGYTVFNSLSSRNTSIEVDLTPYEIYIAPGETVVFAAQCASATSFGISINWNEDN